MAKQSSKKGKKAMKISFAGVDKEIKKGGRAAKIPEGDYLFKIVDFEVRTNKSEDGKYINWKCQVAKGKFKGKIQYGMTSLKTDALWNLRNLIFAATGKNVAGKAINFDPSNLIGKLVGGNVEQEEYEKKMRSRIQSFFPEADIEEADEDDEEDDDEEDEEDEDEEDEDEEDDEDEDDEDDDDLEEVDVEDI